MTYILMQQKAQEQYRMSVNPSELKLFAAVAEKTKGQKQTPFSELTVAESRAAADLFIAYAGAAADILYRNTHVPARDGHPIPIRIYNPDHDDSKPVYIAYPGSGYILPTFETNAIAFSRVAAYADVKVIAVDYRLCPEVSLLTLIHDVYDATKYIAQHSKEFSIDPNKIIIGGLSSGAHAAAAVASMSRHDPELNILHQILLNGMYSLEQYSHDYDSFEAEDKICQRGWIDFAVRQYGVKLEYYQQMPFSPLFEKDVSGIPNTTFLIAEYDGLRNDSEAYYQHLKSQNNNIERILLPGQTHNTLITQEMMDEGQDPAINIAEIIRQYD